ARAAFGVILITTKSGEEGNTKITYNTNFSWSTFKTKTDFITTGWDWLQLNERVYKNALGRNFSGYSEEDYDAIYERRNDETENPNRPWVMVKPGPSGNDVYKYYGNFNWFDYYYNKWRPKQKHNL